MGISNMLMNAMKTYQQEVPVVLHKKKQPEMAGRCIKPLSNRMTVGRLLEQIQPMPSDSVLLGQCSDGLPFLLSLSAHGMGAVLVSGDYGCGKTHQLQVMANSAMRTNPPDNMQVSVLTSNTDEWAGFQQSARWNKCLRGVHAWYDERAEMVIQELSDLAEIRRSGQCQGANVLMILDGLNFIEALSFEAQVHLHWLLEYGSQAGIWIVGAISAGLTDNYRYWIDPFRIRLVGKTQSKHSAAILSMRPDIQANLLEPGLFKAWSGDAWFTYRLPLLGD